MRGYAIREQIRRRQWVKLSLNSMKNSEIASYGLIYTELGFGEALRLKS